MPCVNIRITNDGTTASQKQQMIDGVSELLVRVFNKDPAETFGIIDEADSDNWGLNSKSIPAIRHRQIKEDRPPSV